MNYKTMSVADTQRLVIRIMWREHSHTTYRGADILGSMSLDEVINSAKRVGAKPTTSRNKREGKSVGHREGKWVGHRWFWTRTNRKVCRAHIRRHHIGNWMTVA